MRQRRDRHLDFIARALREFADWLDGDVERVEAASHTIGWVYPITQEAKMGEITVRVGDQAQRASVVWFDAEGNEVEPDTTPSWTSSDEAVATLITSEDGSSALVEFVGAGSAVIESSTIETADDGTETTVRATGLVNVDPVDVDAVTGEVTFASEESSGEAPAPVEGE